MKTTLLIIAALLLLPGCYQPDTKREWIDECTARGFGAVVSFTGGVSCVPLVNKEALCEPQ